MDSLGNGDPLYFFLPSSICHSTQTMAILLSLSPFMKLWAFPVSPNSEKNLRSRVVGPMVPPPHSFQMVTNKLLDLTEPTVYQVAEGIVASSRYLALLALVGLVASVLS